MSKRILWNEDWGFILSDYEGVKEVDFDASALERVQIPHDWSVTLPFKMEEEGKSCGFLQGGVGWYRKELYLSGEETVSVRYRLLLEGVFHTGTVYVNGCFVGSRPYGYFPAVYDITSFLKNGMNVIAIRVDNTIKEASRWYNGSGIFRDVWILKSGETYISQDGVWVRTPEVSDECAEVEVRVTVENLPAGQLCVFCVVRDNGGREVAGGRAEAGEACGFLAHLSIKNPWLWSVRTPGLYELTVTLHVDGILIDTESVTFGVRKLEWISGKGFYLNHVPTKLKGVCLHHDVGVVGAAATESLLERRLVLLREMGCNAVRTCHNPWGTAFYNLCDRMGILVMDEIFDGWETAKAKSDYGLYFEEWHERDLAAIIRRDRNHPSVILWCIGNEVTDMKVETLQRLQGIVGKMDPDRPVTCAVQGVGERSEACRALLPVAGYNDGGGACFLYERDHEWRPEQLMVATESPHTLHTRGFYRTQTWWRDKNQSRKEIENLSQEEIFSDGGPFYHSSYDNAGVRLCARDSWNQTLKLDYLIGEFRWTGFDYYGESGGWPARSVGMGVVDTAGIPKDHYYLYQSMWVDREERPVLHMLPHWTHPAVKKGTIIPVWLYTNCDSVELFLNGTSMGRQSWNERRFIQYDVPYEPGCIFAVARIGENVVLHTEYRTALSPQRLSLTWVNQAVCRRKEDYREIRLTILDGQGTEVPDAEAAVTFFGSGYHIIGTENGDHTDLTPLGSCVRKAFYGKCMALVLENPAGAPLPVLYAAAILSSRYFERETEVMVAVQALDYHGAQTEAECRVLYRINGQKWRDYSGSFLISETSVVEARILVEGQQEVTVLGNFIKGNRPVYQDLIHGNRPVLSEIPPGPYSDKMAGWWNLEGHILEFKSDGVLRLMSGDSWQNVGWWWYDFPIDAFEDQEYAGTGEIWFLSGERAAIKMESQDAEMVLVDNCEYGFRTAYDKKEQLLIRKLHGPSDPAGEIN